MNDSIKDLTAKIVEWADSAFPGRTTASIFMKFFSEIGELVDRPASPGEHADVAILLFDLAQSQGVDLGQAIRDKLRINRGRKWELTHSGVYRHKEAKELRPSASNAYVVERTLLDHPGQGITPHVPPISGYGEFQDEPMYRSTSGFNKLCYAMGGEHSRMGAPLLNSREFVSEVNERLTSLSGAWKLAAIEDKHPPSPADAHQWYKMGYEKAAGDSHD